MKLKQRYTRKFLGKISDFIDKRERDHEKKHLSAYLKGHEQFADGYERQPDGKPIIDYMKNGAHNIAMMRPKMYPVQQQLIVL